MSRRTIVLVIIVLCLSVSTVVFGQKCKYVNANFGELGPVLFDPDCNGYDLCQSIDLHGTLNGLYTVYLNFDGIIWVDDNTLVNIDFAVIETNQGDVYLDERLIIHWDAPNGWAVHANVIGGTGKYEGATGWMAQYIEFAEKTTGLYRGEICVPEE